VRETLGRLGTTGGEFGGGVEGGTRKGYVCKELELLRRSFPSWTAAVRIPMAAPHFPLPIALLGVIKALLKVQEDTNWRDV